MAIQAQLYTDNLGFPLGCSQDLMDNGCGFNQFSFSPQQHQQQMFQQQQQPFSQILPQKNNQNLMNVAPKYYNNNNNVCESLTFSNTLASQVEKQSIEIDHFISLQNERLRLVIHEQRKQQLAMIWRKYESKIQFLLKQKDEEIAKAANKTKELEEFLKKIETEKQTWQRIAMENESTVISLNNTIEQLRENAYFCSSTNGVPSAEDAESCCEYDEQENAEQQTLKKKMLCKKCNSRNACMIFLPCRHLSSCKDCDSSLHQCPVCGIVKKASIEALF